MAQRFRPSGRRSFGGDDYLELAVPQSHFLRHLKDLLDWEGLTQDLADCYQGGAEYGRVPYQPAVPFKMLLLAYRYNLSERRVEQFGNENLPARYFLGLGGHQAAPDHSTLSVFRERVIKKTGRGAFEERLKAIVGTAQEAGIGFGHIQVADRVGRQSRLWRPLASGCHPQHSGCRCEPRPRAATRRQSFRWKDGTKTPPGGARVGGE